MSSTSRPRAFEEVYYLHVQNSASLLVLKARFYVDNLPGIQTVNQQRKVREWDVDKPADPQQVIYRCCNDAPNASCLLTHNGICSVLQGSSSNTSMPSTSFVVTFCSVTIMNHI